MLGAKGMVEYAPHSPFGFEELTCVTSTPTGSMPTGPGPPRDPYREDGGEGPDLADNPKTQLNAARLRVRTAKVAGQPHDRYPVSPLSFRILLEVDNFSNQFARGPADVGCPASS